ncbi:ATPase, T2SS/T4P/T4SS family [Natronobeatus ordinarius]|uniref:ATPase, T2SS/T4P/T4SS family n=1 Tax=Natronobeatus ordinarius TaxID=2963433 RepID=UPI0020CCA0E3|nr:ATPase, T2SS/T4P/T4SS family [Natronobeatus ordinarius]
MAIDEADGTDAGHLSGSDPSASESDERDSAGPIRDSSVRVGEYTWADFMEEYGHGDEVSSLYGHGSASTESQLGLETGESADVPTGTDWDDVTFDPETYLGYHPDDLSDLITDVFGPNAKYLNDAFLDYVDPETTPVVKDVYTWEHYKWEYYYDDDGARPRTKDGTIEPFDEEAALGFDPDDLEAKLSQADDVAMALDDVIDERTVTVSEDLDEDDFFSTDDGHTTVVNRYDLEKAVPLEKKAYFREEERYWVNKPYTFIIIFHSEKENEKKYYAIEPYLNEIETELQEFLSGKLRTAIKYADDGVKHTATDDDKQAVIETETRKLLKRYDLFEKPDRGDGDGILGSVTSLFGDGDDSASDTGASDTPAGDSSTHSDDDEQTGLLGKVKRLINDDDAEASANAGEGEGESADKRRTEPLGELDGIVTRPEPVLLEEDSDTLNEYQVEKLLYMLKRNFIGYERIDPIKHDINVEDISVDGYNSPVFVYHSEYEQIISNIYHGEKELDDFVVKLAQRSGKGISKRLPQVDATLPDGSRAQLTLGAEVSDHGTNYTIRQFKDVPFTPIDLINWNTFSLDEMAFLWLCIENHKSLIFAGGTASGKTTSLNAVSLFIPSSTKIVSIEDTREVELPQRNWIASVTRPSFSDDAQGDVDEFDLLEAALRQRPDYIVMGEIRGEEGRTAFQVMSTGHTTYTTFHADSVDEVLKRFTTDPINVSKTMFTALDLVSIQTQTRVQGRKVRRNKSLTEINHYEAENDEINVQDVYQWQAETDEYLKMGDSNILDEIQFDRGWSYEKLEEELFKRQAILAYLIKNGLNTYAQVAATVQAFINDPETILTLIANGQLEESLEDLRTMESVLIDVDPEKEALVPRPDATDETYNLSLDILERAEESLFEEYRGKVPSGLGSVIDDIGEADPIEVDRADVDEFDFEGEVDDGVEEAEWELGDGSAEFTFDDDVGTEPPSWLEDDSGFVVADTADASADDAEPADASADADGEAPERPQLEAAQPTTDEAEAADSETAVPASEGAAGDSAADGHRSAVESSTGEEESDGDETLDLETDAAPAGTGFGFESEDEDDDDVGSLFEDMGSTLEELERAESATESASGSSADADDDPESIAEQDALDSIFADDELEPESTTKGDPSSEEPSSEEPESTDGEPSTETADTAVPEQDIDADRSVNAADSVVDEAMFEEGATDDEAAGDESVDRDDAPPGERADTPTSVFEDAPESIFSDESDEDETDGGSLFDDAADSPFERAESSASSDEEDDA